MFSTTQNSKNAKKRLKILLDFEKKRLKKLKFKEKKVFALKKPGPPQSTFKNCFFELSDTFSIRSTTNQLSGTNR